MRALAMLTLLTLAQGGCYAPNPPSGSYLCTSGDLGNDLCPEGLTCSCGQCVKHVTDAVCKFTITAECATTNENCTAVTTGEPSLVTNEHTPFKVTISALDVNGNPATSFGGSVSLTSTWGDVRVCPSSTSCPSSTANQTVPLTAGVGTGFISLDRETSPPQSAILRASYATAVGTSGNLRLTINSPVFVRDTNPIVPPVTSAATKWGFADLAAGAPYVVDSGGDYNMFFVGISNAGTGKAQTGIGLATSPPSAPSNGFAPPSTAIVQLPAGNSLGSPAAIVDSTGVHLYYPQTPATFPVASDPTMTFTFGYENLQLENATAFNAAFTPGTPASPISLTTTPPACPYCIAIDTPALLPDPTPALNGGTPDAKILYFSALESTGTGTATTYSASVVRAYASDGQTFAVDPSPLIKSNSDEAIIYSPRVLVDGTIYKMWYTYTSRAELLGSGFVNFCALPPSYRVGYATSSDGYFWVRSPRNQGAALAASTAPGAPAMPISQILGGSWDAYQSVLVGSVMPEDGQDPANGIVLYYSAFGPVAGDTLKKTCVPNGIGRAVRP